MCHPVLGYPVGVQFYQTFSVTDPILYFDAKLSDPFYADFFVVLLPAIDGKQEVGDQAGKDLHHGPIISPGDQMVDSEVAFPPCKEFFHVPSELVNESDLLYCQIITAGGNPVFLGIHSGSDEPERSPALIDTGCTQQKRA